MEWQLIETCDVEQFRDNWELRVLTFDEDGEILLSYYSHPDPEDGDLEGYWCGSDGLGEYAGFGPTHWTPLPAPPK